MEQINLPSLKLFDEAHLPQLDCHSPNDWISLDRILHLSRLVQRKAEILSFAFLASEAGAIGDMGQFGKHLLQSSTLNEALHRYCDNQIYYRSSASCYLMRGQNCNWFCRQTKGHFDT